MKFQMRDGSGWRKYNRVVEDVDRHGNVRVYYRPGKGKPKIRLSSTPGTAEFETEYHRARNSELSPGPSLSKAGRPIAAPGTMLEHILQIVLEGIRNTRRHGHASSGAISYTLKAGRRYMLAVAVTVRAYMGDTSLTRSA